MRKMKIRGRIIDIDGAEIEYGKIPSSAVNDWGQLIYFFETRQQQKNHDEVVNKAIEMLINENRGYGVEWRETNRLKMKDNYYYQLTIVALRVRDSY